MADSAPGPAPSRPRRPRWLAAGVVGAAVGLAWSLPSDVVHLIVRQEDVLLGRYSVVRLFALAGATLLALPLVAMLLAGTPPAAIALRLLLLSASTALGFAVVSILSAGPVAQPRYLETPVRELLPGDEAVGLIGSTRRRQPDRRFPMHRTDRPAPARSYPDAPPGFPAANVVLTTDALGFRNREPADRAEVVVAGDSFAEGSMVDDHEAWPARLARETGRSVYNVAVSGASPREYLNNVAAFGLPKQPRLVLVMVYEGNDFKERGPPPAPTDREVRLTWGEEIGRLRRLAFRDSPVRARLKARAVRRLGPIGADRPVPPDPTWSWMPVRIGEGERAAAYTFVPKRLMRLDWDPQEFERSPKWTTNAEIFLEIRDLVRARGAEPAFVYAPSRAHVLMPLIRDTVTAEQIWSFARHVVDDLPAPETFRSRIFARIESQEQVFFAFCAREGIACVSLTEALRAAMARGEPVYFTYDQHWTRVGHVLVADCLADFVAGALEGAGDVRARSVRETHACPPEAGSAPPAPGRTRGPAGRFGAAAR